MEKMDFLRVPVPKSTGTLKLTILRKKGLLNKLSFKKVGSETYYLYDKNRTAFFINCRRNNKSSTPDYLLSTELDEFNVEAESYFGRLMASSNKSSYVMRNDGIAGIQKSTEVKMKM
jgi:hypothetical protein